jgi:O-succinylbenzoic acid--CoA ligase
VQLTRLVEESQHNPRVRAAMRRFDRILLGGQRPSPELLEQAADLDLRVSVTYGASETCGGCVYDGVPIGNTRARVVAGRLELAGAVLANGYLDDPERTDAAFYEADGARWYRTGDLGAIADGRVTVLGRSDNVIISGGEKVSLDAVERSVRGLSGFGDAVVVAAASEQWGQVPAVAVAGVGHGDLAELRRHVRSELGGAAAPAHLVVVEELPQLSSGKPDRVAIRRLVAERIGQA